MPFTLRDVPAAMRAEGWEIGAQAMERWFAKPARAMSREEKINGRRSPDIETRLITMRWARGFSRVASAEAKLISTWSNAQRLAAARPVLESRVRSWRRSHATTGNRAFRFGNLAAATADVDATAQINIEKVESPFFSVDDFYAAIGNCMIKIAVSGMVTPLANG